MRVLLYAMEVLEIRVLGDLLYKRAVGQLFAFLDMRAPSAILRGFAGCPLWEGNRLAYNFSSTPQSIRVERTIHSFFSSSCIPQLWLKSKKVIWCPATILYMAG